MMNYDPELFTYGVELEYGNCYRHAPLPDGAVWNAKDNTCVSSTGIANDPDGVLYVYGGEINTRPTKTVEEQVEHIHKINTALTNPSPIVNYRSNLHIHVRVPGLKDDLVSCKKLLSYIDKHQQEAFSIVERVPVPVRGASEEVYTWALKRMKRRYKSHQYKLPQNRVAAMMAATTTKEFYEEHAPLTDKGRSWYFSPRAGVNLRQMWEETETIEFRHFPGTLDMEEMHSAILWCKEFLNQALNLGGPPSEIPKNFKFKFPEFGAYEFETEQIYQWTNFATNSKETIRLRLEELRGILDIDNIAEVTSLDVFPHLRKIQGKELPESDLGSGEDVLGLFGG